MHRTPAGRSRTDTVLVALLVYYVPLVGVSLCNLSLPLLVMATLYLAPLAVLALGVARLGLRAASERLLRPAAIPARV